MTLILALAAVPAVVDWWSVVTNRASIESVAKPLVMIVMIVALVASAPTVAGWCVVVALGCSLLGDLALLPRIDRFFLGLGAFFVGHLFFVAAFVLSDDWSTVALLIGLICAAIAAVGLGQPIIDAAHRSDPSLRWPVAAYIAVLMVMLASGIATGALFATLGAILFSSSDAILGWNRFVTPLTHGRLLTHIPYHLGQGLITLWAIGL